MPEKVRLAPKRSVQTPQREWFKKGPLATMLLETINNPSNFLKDIINIMPKKHINNTVMVTMQIQIICGNG